MDDSANANQVSMRLVGEVQPAVNF
jgi:hypothetical protein